MMIDVLDSHVHLTSPKLKNEWIENETDAFRSGVWSLKRYKSEMGRSDRFRITSCVFVECFNVPAVREAKWVLGLCKDSIVEGVVAQVPCKDGADAVRVFLNELRDEAGSLPENLKGARQVFLGSPMPKLDACLENKFLEGLQELARHGLHWEFAVQPGALPYVLRVVQTFPKIMFVLDHLGHNAGHDSDIKAWKKSIDALAKYPNVVVKMGACEEWGVSDPLELIKYGLKKFGFLRCIAESNWFVNVAFKPGYAADRNFHLLLTACKHFNATEADIKAVFSGNARRIYRTPKKK
jgi:predicted TIM-barrel fold metal-dependent hydrolase